MQMMMPGIPSSASDSLGRLSDTNLWGKRVTKRKKREKERRENKVIERNKVMERNKMIERNK